MGLHMQGPAWRKGIAAFSFARFQISMIWKGWVSDMREASLVRLFRFSVFMD